MAQFNKDLVDFRLLKCDNLTLEEQTTRKHGRFLADKSYAFDTMFFVCRYIQYFRFGDRFMRGPEERDRENQYITDLFGLTSGSSQVRNYFTEALALLRFVNAVEKDGPNYRIIDDDILEIFSSSFENAYIFLYLLCYKVFHNDNIWHYYVDFCKATTLKDKQAAYDRYRAEYIKHDVRVKNKSKRWAIFTPKYPMVVLNYANRQNMVARTGVVSKKTVNRFDISLNTEGTRSNYDMPKKNSYLKDMSESYIIQSLRNYLTDTPYIEPVTYSDSISIDIADTKLQMLAERYNITVRRKSQGDKYRYNNGVKTRTVHGEFRGGLLKKTPHVCPVCGFKYEDFLIASHIKPYAKCEDTYDAMNPNNGFLMCPVCDKLFESANLITIDASTGDVIYSQSIENEDDFQYLHNRTIPFDYIDCERRHYLKWHNELFRRKHRN